MASPPPPLRLLYLHGLETDLRVPDTGKTKVAAMRSTFGGEALVLPDLGTGRAAFDRPNSVLRSLLRLPQLHAAAALAACSLAFVAATQPAHAALLSFAPLLLLALLAWTMVPAAVEGAVERSLAVAEKELGRSKVDLLIGSSWGGALAALCVQRGTWSGPVLLLAPAGARIGARCSPGSKLAQMLAAPLPPQARGLVVHGTRDKTVPLGDSEALCKHMPQALRVIKGCVL